ncbi:MAG: tetratricopeptide repeat protein [Nitrosomonadales bacterium]|nr:tetratricopeptide repeat protein [Nitrosomonadales bacterium]
MPNRNDHCPCGSGKKYKKCCLPRNNELAASRHSEATLASVAIQSALEHHQAGRLSQAAALYQQILQTEPTHPDALHFSGVIAHQTGKNESAVELIAKAIAINSSVPMYHNNLGLALQALDKQEAAVQSYQKALSIKPDFVEAHNNLGNAYLAQGMPDDAAKCYRKALALRPDFADAHYNLGNVLKDQGQLDSATESYRRAIVLKPDYADAHFNLGHVFRLKGMPDEAAESYCRAIGLKPDYADAHYNLGHALRLQGRLDDAIESYYKVLMLSPDYIEAYSSLGNALQAQGKFAAAVESYRQALLLKPEYAEAHNNMGAALQNQGKSDAAIEHFFKAFSLKPDYAEAYYNVGAVLQGQGNLDAAVEYYRKALEVKPDYAEAHNNLGAALRSQGKPDEATACFHRALSVRPDHAETYNNLGLIFKGQGKLETAIEYYYKALSIKPDLVEAYDNLLFLHGYNSTLSPQEYLALARGWELSCVSGQDRQTAHGRVFRNSSLAGRRLRIGYVSGDYRQHAVSYFVEQLFARHDRERIELFAYSSHGRQDAVTLRLQALAEHWVSIAGMPDAAVRDCIEADEIDVLIDLSGHTEHNRLGVFARRAAPVQTHYLGYFASTGLTEMDYWIGDEILTPHETDSHFSEQVWRLPRVWISYDGKADAPPPDWHPAPDGSVWLGSFNNLGKLTPATLALWASVLHALPEGKLLLKTKELAEVVNRRRILDVMATYGIAPDRIELQDSGITPDWLAHMAYYNRLDIALDPVAGVGGGTTSCDALWMGVPVVALKGDRMAARMTATMLDSIGHPEWIACSEAEYVGKVVVLARDVALRKTLRLTQRGRMAESPLCDARGLGRSLENAYFEMFGRWLKERAGSGYEGTPITA